MTTTHTFDFWLDFIRETVRGKDSYRIFANHALQGTQLIGKVLDVGAGSTRGSHYRYLTLEAGASITSVDIDPKEQPDILADISQGIPVSNGAYNTVLALNVLEHVPDASAVLSEVSRVLVPGGKLYIVVPFFVRVHPTPHDFYRYTNEGLEHVLRAQGFRVEQLTPFGTGAFLAAHYQLELIIPWIIRLITVPLSCICDSLAVRFSKSVGRMFYPLGYAVVATKQ